MVTMIGISKSEDRGLSGGSQGSGVGTDELKSEGYHEKKDSSF